MTIIFVKNEEGEEMHYGIAQSFERIPGQAWDQPDRAGETGRRVQADDQPYREGRLLAVGDAGAETGDDLSGEGGGYL